MIGRAARAFGTVRATRGGAAPNRLVVLFCLAVALVAGMPGRAARTDIESVYEAYVINFVRYTRWPDSGTAGTPYVIAVLGSPESAASLRELAALSGPIDGHPLVVRSLTLNAIAPARDQATKALRDGLDDARVIYVAPSHRGWNDAAIGAVANRPVLTVGVGGAFVAQGGMLGLFEHDGRVNFSANDSAIKAASIDVSARVLMLARQAPPRPEGD